MPPTRYRDAIHGKCSGRQCSYHRSGRNSTMKKQNWLRLLRAGSAAALAAVVSVSPASAGSVSNATITQVIAESSGTSTAFFV
jgi:hypothetical protein